MPMINITDECMREIRAHARGALRSSAVRRPDGTWDVPVDDEVAARIAARSFPGETPSDMLLRAFAVQDGRVN